MEAFWKAIASRLSHDESFSSRFVIDRAISALQIGTKLGKSLKVSTSSTFNLKYLISIDGSSQELVMMYDVSWWLMWLVLWLHKRNA
jgi:hypothetical protein